MTDEKHDGCPYRCTCDKDQSKCCYLVSNKCIINDYKEEEARLV